MKIQIRYHSGATKEVEYNNADELINNEMINPEVEKISFDFLGSRLVLYTDGDYWFNTGKSSIGVGKTFEGDNQL